MSNTLAPFGFMPVRRLDGATWTGNMTHRLIASANTHKFYQGDVVQELATGYIDTVGPGVGIIAGIFVNCEYLSTSQSRKVWSNQFPGADAAADVDAYIIDDPWVVFLVQSYSTAHGPIVLADVGSNANFSTTAGGGATNNTGNSRNGLSGAALDAEAITNLVTDPFRIIGIPGITEPNLIGSATAFSPNGYDATSADNLCLVAFNNQTFKTVTGT